MPPTVFSFLPLKTSALAILPLAMTLTFIAFSGRKEKTVGGMTKASFIRNKSGKIVSKKASERAKKNFASSGLKAWTDAVKAARKALNLTGFVAVGGKSATGKALYAKAKFLLK